MLLSRAVHQESSCPAHAHRARASCLPDSNPYGRDGLAHSRSRALCVLPKSVSVSLLLLTIYIKKIDAFMFETEINGSIVGYGVTENRNL